MDAKGGALRCANVAYEYGYTQLLMHDTYLEMTVCP